MKKKLFILLVFIGFTYHGFSQIDIQISPLALFYKKLDLSVEYGLNPKAGLELGMENTATKVFPSDEFNFKIGNSTIFEGSGDFTLNRTSLYLHFKYYISPPASIDGFHIGTYLRYTKRKGKFDGTVDDKNYNTNVKWSKIIIGGTIGYKFTQADPILFGISTGLGYALISNLDTQIEVIDKAAKTLIFPLRLDYFGQLSIGYRFLK